MSAILQKILRQQVSSAQRWRSSISDFEENTWAARTYESVDLNLRRWYKRTGSYGYPTHLKIWFEIDVIWARNSKWVRRIYIVQSTWRQSKSKHWTVRVGDDASFYELKLPSPTSHFRPNVANSKLSTLSIAKSNSMSLGTSKEQTQPEIQLESNNLHKEPTLLGKMSVFLPDV